MKRTGIKVLRAAVLALSAMACGVQAHAQAAEKPEAAIKRVLEGVQGLKVESVAPSEISGFYLVRTKASRAPLYATADGKYFVAGDLYQVDGPNYVNIDEQRREGERAKELAAVKPNDMIIFKAKGPTKTVLNVFTDVDCHYCQVLHKEVPQLNAMGIEVRYLAYPREGIGSPTYQKLVTAWCAKDRQGTLTRYKNRENVPISTCADNPVAAEFDLGTRLGVEGTPALVTAKGELISGYVPAAKLAEKLGVR